MNHFNYKNSELHCEDASVAEIAAQVGTPFYLYSSATLNKHFQAVDNAFADIPHITCFATKAC